MEEHGGIRRPLVVLISSPFHGHMTPTLQLATTLHAKGFTIAIAHSKLNPPNPSNHPSDFTFLPLSADLPAIDNPGSDFINTLNNSCKPSFREHLTRLISEGNKSIVVVYDNVMHFAGIVAVDLNLVALLFRSSSAAFFPAFLARLQLRQRGRFLEDDKLQPRCETFNQETSSSRRNLLASFGGSLAFNYGFAPLVALAEDEQQDESLVGAIKSLFDPNEKTKSGKVLPKAYLNSAREVVKTLRDSLKEDPNDMAKFRRVADAAKESIREYLANWRGQQSVINEESYVVIEKAIRTLAGFYSKAGPSAPLPEQVKSEIISNLDTADKFL